MTDEPEVLTGVGEIHVWIRCGDQTWQLGHRQFCEVMALVTASNSTELGLTEGSEIRFKAPRTGTYFITGTYGPWMFTVKDSFKLEEGQEAHIEVKGGK